MYLTHPPLGVHRGAVSFDAAQPKPGGRVERSEVDLEGLPAVGNALLPRGVAALVPQIRAMLGTDAVRHAS